MRAWRSPSSPARRSLPPAWSTSIARVAGPTKRVPASALARPLATSARRSAWAWRSVGTSTVRTASGPAAGSAATRLARSAGDWRSGCEDIEREISRGTDASGGPREDARA